MRSRASAMERRRNCSSAVRTRASMREGCDTGHLLVDGEITQFDHGCVHRPARLVLRWMGSRVVLDYLHPRSRLGGDQSGGEDDSIKGAYRELPAECLADHDLTEGMTQAELVELAAVGEASVPSHPAQRLVG